MNAATAETPVVILGAGGHAKVIIELLRQDRSLALVGLVDVQRTRTDLLGVRVIGSDGMLPELRRGGVKHAFVALGDNRARLNAARRLRDCDFQLVNAISSHACISPSARVGRGVAIMAGAVVNAETVIEDLAILNTRASVDHDGYVGEAAHIAPGCALAGRVHIGSLAFIGTGTSAIPGITVGENSLVGAGSCIVRDIPANSLAFGVPARIVRAYEHPPSSRD
jgi:UDP-perosamine 4-acetyltransferase